MKEWVDVLRAADMAAKWHVDQRRKGAAEEPYINHLLEVARLAAEATGGADHELVIAALFHDAVEDQDVPLALIAREFGERVAALVAEVTDDKTLPKSVRKAKQVETARSKSPAARIIKLADKTSNVLAVGNSPASGWSQERRVEYIQWARRVVHGLSGVSTYLEERFEQAAAASEIAIAAANVAGPPSA